MYTVLYGKIDYYITMENKEVISFEISNSTKSYMAAVSVCVWGRAQVCENINPLPFSFLTFCKKKKKNPMHIRQKPVAKVYNGFFLRLKKFP